MLELLTGAPAFEDLKSLLGKECPSYNLVDICVNQENGHEEL